jgi:hypothetical protein
MPYKRPPAGPAGDIQHPPPIHRSHIEAITHFLRHLMGAGDVGGNKPLRKDTMIYSSPEEYRRAQRRRRRAG